VLGGRELIGRLAASAALGAALLVTGHASAGVLAFVDATSIFTTGQPGLGWVDAVTVSPDGRNLYAASSHDLLLDAPALSVFRRDDAGVLQFVQVYSEGAAGFDTLCGLGQSVISPDGRHIYVAASCSDRVRIFERDPSDGRIRPIGEVVHEDQRADGLHGVLAMSISPDGAHLYVGLDRDDGLGVFRRDPTSGLLTWQEGHTLPGPHAYGSALTRGMAISPDGTSLYVPSRDDGGDEDALHVFRRDPADGSLTLVETLRDGTPPFVSLGDMANAAISPDGRHVYAGFVYDPERVMMVFRRDEASGRLTPIQAASLRTPPLTTGAIVVSADGRLVFASGDSTLSVLRRDVVTGILTRVERHQHVGSDFDGLSMLAGPGSATGIAVDPTGTDVYTASSGDGSIGHFHRTCPDGVLDPGEACDDGNDTDADGCNALCQVETCFACDGAPSLCLPTSGTACDDHATCTQPATCDLGVCVPGAPVADGTRCDDGNACTTNDMCERGVCAGGPPPTCGTCESCDPRWGCVGALHSGCVRSPTVGRYGALELRPSAATSRLRFRWEGVRRAYDPASLGDPTTTTAWTLCLYDRTGLPAGVRRRRRSVLALQVPAGGTCDGRGCWHRRGNGFRYRDPAGTADGVTRMTLAAPAPDKTLMLEARGPLVDVPLPLTTPATVQLRNDDGACWQQDWYAYVRMNDAEVFAGRGGLERPCQGCFE
jgi:cysteine-rich repeat protein